eukprot:8983376-Alexandrium_andersonii.AAC.1
MVGNTERAKNLKRKFAEGVEREWEARSGFEPDWEQVCEVSRKVALEVLGQEQKPHPLVWLVGKEEEKRALD